MKRFTGLALAALALTACDSTLPTAPDAPPAGPRFATNIDVSISGKGTAEWLSDREIETHATFTCPEGLVAIIDVFVDQPLPVLSNKGSGQTSEHCRVGPNTVSIRVTGGPSWDIAKAVATFTLSLVKDPTNPKDVLATAKESREILITTH